MPEELFSLTYAGTVLILQFPKEQASDTERERFLRTAEGMLLSEYPSSPLEFIQASFLMSLPSITSKAD